MIMTKTIRSYQQQGFSLVELMVALTISLVLMAGVGQIYISTKASYNLQNGLGRLQENARSALDILSHNIGQAGYTSDLDGLDSFNSANTQENLSENVALGYTVANGTASDVIEINYASATDCLGNATVGTATDRYYINGNTLMCLGNGSATAGVLAEGIENMQILYGEDTDNDELTNVFVNAGNVTDWDAVKSVRIALLASTTETMGTASTDSSTHVLLNTRPIGPLNDNMLRRVFTKTIVLRN